MNAEEEDEVITRSAMNVLARVSLSLPKEQRTLEMDEGIYYFYYFYYFYSIPIH